MSKICIHIPDSELVNTVGLEVTVGDERRLANYRIESFEWPEDMSSVERVDRRTTCRWPVRTPRTAR